MVRILVRFCDILRTWDATTGPGHFESGATSGTFPFGSKESSIQSRRFLRIREAKKLRDQILGRKARGEIGTSATEQDHLRRTSGRSPGHAKHNAKASTANIWRLVIDANLRPFFGHLRASRAHDRETEGISAQTAFGGPAKPRAIASCPFCVQRLIWAGSAHRRRF